MSRSFVSSQSRFLEIQLPTLVLPRFSLFLAFFLA